MPELVTAGAMLSCSFGAAPSALAVLPANRVLAGGMPVATIMDHVPVLNIPPFGNCSSPGNPNVSAATAAALGVLTPMPCIPATVAPWTRGTPRVMVAKLPALCVSDRCMCAWGGTIAIDSPAQTSVSAGDCG